jgi:hypothetical protein
MEVLRKWTMLPLSMWLRSNQAIEKPEVVRQYRGDMRIQQTLRSVCRGFFIDSTPSCYIDHPRGLKCRAAGLQLLVVKLP